MLVEADPEGKYHPCHCPAAALLTSDHARPPRPLSGSEGLGLPPEDIADCPPAARTCLRVSLTDAMMPYVVSWCTQRLHGLESKGPSLPLFRDSFSPRCPSGAAHSCDPLTAGTTAQDPCLWGQKTSVQLTSQSSPRGQAGTRPLASLWLASHLSRPPHHLAHF